MTPARFLPAGDRAVLVELPDLGHTMALYRDIRAQPIAGVHEMVPAARTLLVHFDPWLCSAQQVVQALLLRLHAVARQAPAEQAAGPLVTVPVQYDGEDLPVVAELLGLDVATLVRRHTEQPYDAAFAGFAPGFVYLSGGAHLQVPRRASPRTKVPAGSVALGGSFSAVYPSASPGGWQLIGRTELAMWDVARAQPAWIQPGCRVQFVDARRAAVQVAVPAAAAPGVAAPAPPISTGAALEVVAAGLQTLVQDLGRRGQAGSGISVSGALDAPALRDANRVLGNPVDGAVLENLLGQLRLRSHGPSTVAVTGAPVELWVHTPQGQRWAASRYAPIALNDGDELQLGAVSAGVRCYVAVRGGWAVEPVLGSRSTDTLAQLGPVAVQAGQRLAVGAPTACAAVQTLCAPEPAWPRAGDAVVLDVVLGPRSDWFSAQGGERLTQQAWTVTPQSNRIGMRLQGAQALERQRQDELPSEGTVVGAIQVPANGQPVLFLADHPLTGGYPVIAVLASYHLALAAQIPVGCQIRFRVVRPWAEYLPLADGSTDSMQGRYKACAKY